MFNEKEKQFIINVMTQLQFRPGQSAEMVIAEGIIKKVQPKEDPKKVGKK